MQVSSSQKKFSKELLNPLPIHKDKRAKRAVLEEV